jgi:hypothetical protein
VASRCSALSAAQLQRDAHPSRSARAEAALVARASPSVLLASLPAARDIVEPALAAAALVTEGTRREAPGARGPPIADGHQENTDHRARTQAAEARIARYARTPLRQAQARPQPRPVEPTRTAQLLRRRLAPRSPDQTHRRLARISGRIFSVSRAQRSSGNGARVEASWSPRGLAAAATLAPSRCTAGMRGFAEAASRGPHRPWLAAATGDQRPSSPALAVHVVRSALAWLRTMLARAL